MLTSKVTKGRIPMKNNLLALSLGLVMIPAYALAKADAFQVDTSKSKATWVGAKLGGSHNGELKIKSGELMVEKGALTGGTVEMDMASLTNKDLSDAESNAKLVGHLKSDDFFSAEKHPTSSFKITKVENKGGKALVSGDLTIKGITKPVVPFPADVKVDKKGVIAKGQMNVDRTLYDIKYRSLKYFSEIGDKVIKDQFQVGFDISSK